MTVFAASINIVSHYTQTAASRLYATPRARVILKGAKQIMKDRQQRAIPQLAIDQAPCVTFREFRKVVKQREWSLEWLVEQSKADLNRPPDTIRRVPEGAWVEGYWDDMADVVLPYRCLIA
jgi:hypothetical protein